MIVERLWPGNAYRNFHYLIACAECMKAADDVFSAKLGAYRKAYDLALPQARAAQRVADDAAGITPVGSGSLFTVDLQRG